MITARSVRRRSSVVFAWTSAIAPIASNVPRPARANSFISQRLGAEPIPTMWSRVPPRRRATSATTSSSFETAPSVIRITRRKTDGSPCSEMSRAWTSAGRISVPLPASRVETQRLAASIAPGSAGMNVSA